MAALGEHPRLARMVLTSARLSCEPLGCMLAALISEGDFLRNAGGGTADVAPRLRMLLDPGSRPGEVSIIMSLLLGAYLWVVRQLAADK